MIYVICTHDTNAEVIVTALQLAGQKAFDIGDVFNINVVPYPVTPEYAKSSSVSDILHCAQKDAMDVYDGMNTVVCVLPQEINAYSLFAELNSNIDIHKDRIIFVNTTGLSYKISKFNISNTESNCYHNAIINVNSAAKVTQRDIMIMDDVALEFDDSITNVFVRTGMVNPDMLDSITFSVLTNIILSIFEYLIACTKRDNCIADILKTEAERIDTK